MGEIQIPPHTRTEEEKIKEVAYQEFLIKQEQRQKQREKEVAVAKQRIKKLIVRTTLITTGVLAGFVIVKARTNDGNIIRQFADKVIEMDNDNINNEWYDDEVVESQRITNQNILENQYDDEWHDDQQEQSKILAK